MSKGVLQGSSIGGLLTAWKRYDRSLRFPAQIKSWAVSLTIEQIAKVREKTIPKELVSQWGAELAWQALANRWAIMTLEKARDASTFAEVIEAFNTGPKDGMLTLLILQKASKLSSSPSQTLLVLRYMSECCHGALDKQLSRT